MPARPCLRHKTNLTRVPRTARSFLFGLGNEHPLARPAICSENGNCLRPVWRAHAGLIELRSHLSQELSKKSDADSFRARALHCEHVGKKDRMLRISSERWEEFTWPKLPNTNTAIL